MLLYDNLEDVKTKLVNTICTHKGKAVLVKQAAEVQPESFVLSVVPLNARNHVQVPLADPDLNYMRFNIGYSNHLHSALWWYRIPMRQYRQGLKGDQMRANMSSPHYGNNVEFVFSRPIADMVEGAYPVFPEAEQLLKNKHADIMAFHKDFACTWDEIHSDLIVEYKGKKIGSMQSHNKFNLLKEYEHLTEALVEAVNY